MTYAPASLLALRSFLAPRTGLSAVALGIVGDTAHAAKGTSYHLGADKLSPTAYSIRTARDKAGLTNAASAIDIGSFSVKGYSLRNLSRWLVGQAQRDAPGTSDMREIIYSPDGKTVLRWDRERGYASAPRQGEADNSHLTHTHVSWYRDAEKRDHVVAFRPYFDQEDIVKVYSVPGSFSGSWPAGTPVYPGPTGAASGKLAEARRLLVVGQDKPGIPDTPTGPTRYLVDGADDGPSGAMAWLPVAGMTGKRDETRAAGVKAAAAAAAKAE